MSALLLLGLVPADAPHPSAAPPHLRLRAGPGRDALAAALPEDGTAPALDWAILQNALLSAYAEQGDVLPVALGAAFSSQEALLAHLETALAQLEERAARLSGRVEYLMTVDAAAAPVRTDMPEAAGYLRQRQAARDRRRTRTEARARLVADLVDLAETLGAEVRRHAVAAPDRIALLSALVPRTAEAALRQGGTGLAADAAAAGATVRMIGPCAPFSFAAETDADE